MSIVRALKGIAASMLAVCIVYGCGGGGGGNSSSTATGSRPPVASAPTCTDALPKRVVQIQAQPGEGMADVMVPPTSIERPSDIGVRVHTNHLMSTRVHSELAGPSGFTPSQISVAYDLPVPNTGSAGAIAIVDAYNYPTALNDFNTFAAAFSLPMESSTVATSSSNRMFQVVYASGQQPASNGGWSQEMAIDIEWAHAMAPSSKIYLVEANSDALGDIATAVNVATSLPGVVDVSTSFGGTETGCTYVQYGNDFVKNGVVFFAAAGDAAGQRNFPALSYNAVAVGGTSLTTGQIGNWVSETVWNGTGCGPSTFEPRPIFQDQFYSKVGLYRAASDIAAVADPNTGVAVYDSYSYRGSSGWNVFGGTSVACPIVAGIVNSSGGRFSGSIALNSVMYAAAGSQYFHPITSGSSGGFSAGTPWCFPTGLGTPNGLAGLLRG